MNYDAVAYWSQIAGFVFFAAALVWAWNTWLTPAIATAQKASNERIALAERRRNDMRESLDVLRREIDRAKHDAELLKARIAERAKQEFDAVVAEAHEAGERVVRNAGGELGRARAAATLRLREELADRALEIAKRDAAARIDDALDARLVSELLATLEGGAARGNRG